MNLTSPRRHELRTAPRPGTPCSRLQHEVECAGGTSQPPRFQRSDPVRPAHARVMDLSTEYMGLALRNPLVASPSPLSHTLDGIRRLADGGVGAIVMFSLFEEQLRERAARTYRLVDEPAARASPRRWVTFRLRPARQRRESSADPRPVALVANPGDRVTHPPLLVCLPSGRCLLQARRSIKSPDAQDPAPILVIGRVPRPVRSLGRHLPESTRMPITTPTAATSAVPAASRPRHRAAMPDQRYRPSSQRAMLR